MIDGLLSTKFHNPLTVGPLTVRPRLDARLEESRLAGCRLVMVTAPAGFGKSTLVSAWVSKQAMPFSWLSLDSSDNEPRQFFSYLVGALQKIDSSLGIKQISRIQTADSADSEAVYADVMASLINEIAVLPNPFYLVLDDCHVLKNPFLVQLLAFLIERQPAQIRLILLTREDLPLPLSRLRVRRQLIEIRQTDLQFTPQEVEDFLCAGMGIVDLTQQDIQALEARTEGWIAGLQLAALSLRYEPDPAQFIHSFTGNDRYILDYLLEEVFSHQSVAIQNFLLSTSILDRFCVPLCEAVLTAYENGTTATTGNSQAPVSQTARAQTLLEQVEHANLFLIPLDNQRQWYRYHHLFTDLLRHGLLQEEASTGVRKVPSLHLQASRWFETNGFIQEAVKHAFLSTDWQYSADLVERHAWNVILHSQLGTVSDWCGAFPEAVMRKRPALCVFHSWALILGFKKENLPLARARIEQAEAALAAVDPQTRADLVLNAPPINLKEWVTGQLTLLRSYILTTLPRRQADPQALTEMSLKSLDQLPAEEITVRSAVLINLGLASQARCDAADADQKFQHACGVALSGGNYYGAVIADYHRAYGLLVRGRLHEAAAFCRQKKKFYEAFFQHPIQEMPAIALFDQVEGCALLELNELAEAETVLRRGLEVTQWMPREELPGFLAQARLCAAKGDSAGLADALRRLEMRWPDIGYCIQALRSLYQLLAHSDDLDAHKSARVWADANPPEVEPGVILPGIGPAWNDKVDYVTYTAWAQQQIILGRTAEALEVLTPMLEISEEYGLIHRVIELSLLQAQAYYMQGQRERAWKALSTALHHAESEGYLRLIDQGPILIRLLQEAAQLGLSPNYIRCMLENDPLGRRLGPIETEPQPVQFPPLSTLDSDGLLEPLSNREIEILALMATGLSHTEIAAHLYLSPNTLKAHTQNIYGKLDVHSRVQAINKARLLKLIE